MSRLLAYLGPPLRPAPLFERIRRDATGEFGFGWQTADGAAAHYHGNGPMAADGNLDGLGRALESGLWLLHGRAPAPRPSAQPRSAGEWLWLLDGAGAPPPLRTALLRHLNPKSEELLERFDLPELTFTLFRQFLEEDEELSVEEALSETLKLVERLAGPLPLALNLAVGDGQRLHLLRHAVNLTPSTLYYTTDEESFPDGQLATDRPGEEGFWHPIPEGHRLTLDHDEPPELAPL